MLKRRLEFHPRPIDYLLFVFFSFAGGREGWGMGVGRAAVPGLEKNRSLLLLIAIHQLNVIVSNRSCESSQAKYSGPGFSLSMLRMTVTYFFPPRHTLEIFFPSRIILFNGGGRFSNVLQCKSAWLQDTRDGDRSPVH